MEQPLVVDRNPVMDEFVQDAVKLAPESLREAVSHILSVKAKRIRPKMVMMACDLFEGDLKEAKKAAVAIELFHNFTLVHDDILDNAMLRRNQPSVHAKFGLNKAVMTGDGLLLFAYRYLGTMSPKLMAESIPVFNKVAMQLLEGQQMDMDFEEREFVPMPEYLRMIEYKTSVLLAAALELGAICGQASPSDRRWMYILGINLGLAFQVMDDYLDAFGDPDKVGKQIGGDIARNKKTFLAVKAWELANTAQRNRLIKAAQLHNGSKLRETLALFREIGVDREAIIFLQEKFKLAMNALNKIKVPESRKQALRSLAEKLHSRSF